MTAKDLKRIIELDNKAKQLTLVIEHAKFAREYRGGDTWKYTPLQKYPPPLRSGRRGGY